MRFDHPRGRLRARRLLLLPAALALALGFLAATASGASRHVSSNSVTFPASPPADPNAPAITTVVVSNDDNGKVTFAINLSNRPALTADMDIAIFLDTDQNAQTGATDFDGADYLIDLSGNSVDLGTWDGTRFSFAKPSPASLVYSYASGGPTITFNAGDIAPALTGFNFYVVAASGIGGTLQDPDYSNAHVNFDPAAGHGVFNYPIKITPLQLSVVSFKTTAAKAGQPFTASMMVGATQAGALQNNAVLTCSAKVGGAKLAPKVHGFAGGKAICGFQVPKTAKGKTITGTVSVSVQGLQVSKPFSVKVQ